MVIWLISALSMKYCVAEYERAPKIERKIGPKLPQKIFRRKKITDNDTSIFCFFGAMSVLPGLAVTEQKKSRLHKDTTPQTKRAAMVY